MDLGYTTRRGGKVSNHFLPTIYNIISIVNFYNTDFQADSNSPNESKDSTRVSQSWRTSEYIRER